jgi:hypothetical protein
VAFIGSCSLPEDNESLQRALCFIRAMVLSDPSCLTFVMHIRSESLYLFTSPLSRNKLSHPLHRLKQGAACLKGDASTRDVSMCQGGPSIPRPHTARVEHARLSMGPRLARSRRQRLGRGSERQHAPHPPPFAETDRPSLQHLHSSLIRGTDDGLFSL